MPAQNAHNDEDRQLASARAELERCLRAGQPCRAEELLASYPALAADPDKAVDLICTEFLLRREAGENPNPAEWCSRFPQWRDRLGPRLQAATPPGNGHSEASTAAERTVALALGQDTPRPAVSRPRSFGRYEVVAEVGRGGMGVVWEARDPVLRRTVALKTIREGRWASEEEVKRFYQEAQAAAQLKHPHIIEIFDINQDGDEHYFAMEHVAGGSLAKCLGRYRDDPDAAAALVEKVARAVQHAHERGVIHRDLKPSNILLDEQGEPKVGDFGLARLTGADSDLTRTGQAPGTPGYMAPEQCEGHATGQSDVWALGVVLYELLTGQRPFSGRTNDEVTHRIRTAEPRSPRALAPGLGRDLETVVLTCLEKDPARRYASAAALADDLASWLKREPIKARPPGLLRRARRVVKRHPAAFTALAFLLLFAVGTALAAPYL
ncbi:MAG TPA: serine/threonine-protein kinase, partial [Gemmataceae bacterium]|nr:serine/threonine-protein kinase [Gemmataceae bacterium]